jgi:hypothetical protein
MKPLRYLCCLLLAQASLAAAPPNILFMLSDDQAWSGLSCQMHPDMPDSKSSFVQTPNIARLAEQGMRFSAAYAPAPVCSPTRISLQTGRNPAALGWTKAAPAEQGHRLIEGDNRKSIRDDEITIGQMLKSAGYATAHYGKWHLSGGGPAAHGYDESDGDTGNQDAAPHLPPNPVDIFGMGSRAVDFMKRSQAARKPFFIQMSYNALHYPENATPALLEKYRKLASGGNDKEVGRAAIAEDLDRGVGELLAKAGCHGPLEEHHRHLHVRQRRLESPHAEWRQGRCVGGRHPRALDHSRTRHRAELVVPSAGRRLRFLPDLLPLGRREGTAAKTTRRRRHHASAQRLIRTRETPARAARVSFPALSRRLTALGDPQRPT